MLSERFSNLAANELASPCVGLCDVSHGGGLPRISQTRAPQAHDEINRTARADEPPAAQAGASRLACKA
jgi:hypothetical protein